MKISRRYMATATIAGLTFPAALVAQDNILADALSAQMFGAHDKHRAGLTLIAERGNPDMAAGLILALRFADLRQHAIARTLEEITGQRLGTDWFQWMLWQERTPEVIPHPVFVAFKREVLLQVDPNFEVFLRPEHLAPDNMRIRLEEITWGGVRKDGIPSLDNPEMIAAADADYLRDDDLVFGISINGDRRAYPLRIMGWHEMFNAAIGGVPVALAYCTLCGAGILFETQLPSREAPLVFGSSGFLYRSNKLMFDRQTHSLWNQFTGRPVVGPLVGSGIELQQRPVVITTWVDWRTSHPKTLVLSLNTGHARDYGTGVVYGGYFSSPDLMFPATVDQSQHRQKDFVFAIRQFGAARAWPLAAFEGRPIINDAIAETALVLIANPGRRSVRAYERGQRHFAATAAGLIGNDGSEWIVTEDALISGDGTRLSRVAGHIAYWFAWDNYLSDVGSVYGG